MDQWKPKDDPFIEYGPGGKSPSFQNDPGVKEGVGQTFLKGVGPKGKEFVSKNS